MKIKSLRVQPYIVPSPAALHIALLTLCVLFFYAHIFLSMSVCNSWIQSLKSYRTFLDLQIIEFKSARLVDCSDAQLLKSSISIQTVVFGGTASKEEDKFVMAQL
jgi:hypothetical protein